MSSNEFITYHFSNIKLFIYLKMTVYIAFTIYTPRFFIDHPLSIWVTRSLNILSQPLLQHWTKEVQQVQLLGRNE
jgi:hypothetical protein